MIPAALRATLRLCRHLLPVAAFVILAALAAGPHVLGYRTMTVLTNSMSPTIPAGSVIATFPQPAADVDVDDVLTFQTPGENPRIVTHRVIEIVEPGHRPVVRTKGDAMDEPDPWTIRLESQAWVTRANVPHAGWILHWAHRDQIRPLLLFALPGLALLVSLVQIWRPRREPAPSGAVEPA